MADEKSNKLSIGVWAGVITLIANFVIDLIKLIF